MPRTGAKQQIGARGEDLACAELERQGMQVLERNWRCRLGEIDIVAAEVGDAGRTLVFCEVKCRSGLGFGNPLEAITFTKMRTLRQLAALWMREHHNQRVGYQAGRHRCRAGFRSAALPDPRTGGGLSDFGLRVVGGPGRP